MLDISQNYIIKNKKVQTDHFFLNILIEKNKRKKKEIEK